MSRKRVITAILLTMIAICSVRIARIGHESDPPVPWWWGWPLQLWAHFSNVLDRLWWLSLLVVMSLPVAVVVYITGKQRALWAGPLRLGRSVSAGALAAVLGLFPAAIMVGLFYEISVPFGRPASGAAAIMSAPFAVLFYGFMLGGFLVAAVLGAFGGAAVYAIAPRSQNPDGPGARVASFIIMSFCIILIDYGLVGYSESRSMARAGVARPYVAGFFGIFLAIALLWSSFLCVRARVACRGTWPLSTGAFVFCSCLYVGLVVGAGLGEVIGFVMLALVMGAVAWGILEVKDLGSHSTKNPRSLTPAGLDDRDLD